MTPSMFDRVSVVVPAPLRRTLESRVETLRRILPAGPATPVLTAELARLQPFYERVRGQLTEGAVMEVPRGMKPEDVIAPPAELERALEAVRDRELARLQGERRDHLRSTLTTVNMLFGTKL